MRCVRVAPVFSPVPRTSRPGPRPKVSLLLMPISPPITSFDLSKLRCRLSGHLLRGRTRVDTTRHYHASAAVDCSPVARAASFLNTSYSSTKLWGGAADSVMQAKAHNCPSEQIPPSRSNSVENDPLRKRNAQICCGVEHRRASSTMW